MGHRHALWLVAPLLRPGLATVAIFSALAAWDVEQGTFVELPPEKFKTQIAQGLRVARKQVAPDLLIVPVAAPSEG